MKYRKKPVIIDAWLFDRPKAGQVLEEMGVGVYTPERDGYEDFITIKTLEGDMLAKRGDYIIRGVQGEYYPCKPDIFQETYEAVEDGSDNAS